MSILNYGGVDMSFKVSWKLHIACFILGYMICIIQQDSIANVLLRARFIHITGNGLIDIYLLTFVVFTPITFIHELLHGAAYRVFGGKVKFGFKGIYAYAQETTGMILHRTKFLIVLLAPVTVISIVSLIIPRSIGYSIFLLNLLGSTGDFLMAVYLCRGNVNSYIVDKNYGFDVIEVKSI